VPSFNRRSVFEFHDQAGISAQAANERSDLAAGDNAAPDAPKVGPAADEYSGMRLAFFTLANAIK
jgi:hypothetical protein